MNLGPFFQRLAETVLPFLPEGWKSLRLEAEFEDDAASFELEVRLADDATDGVELDGAATKRILTTLRDLRATNAEISGEPFTGAELTIHSNGSFESDFTYGAY